jgi:hypothetical protein
MTKVESKEVCSSWCRNNAWAFERAAQVEPFSEQDVDFTVDTARLYYKIKSDI